jgi:cobalamin biosynthesis Mg chelatase CobN
VERLEDAPDSDSGSTQISLSIERHKEQTYEVVPDSGKNLVSLYYNGEDVTDQMEGNTYTAPAIIADGSLKAVFRNASSGTNPPAADGNDPTEKEKTAPSGGESSSNTDAPSSEEDKTAAGTDKPSSETDKTAASTDNSSTGKDNASSGENKTASEKQETGQNKTASPNTGDPTNVPFWSGLFLLSGCCLVSLGLWQLRRRKTENRK